MNDEYFDDEVENIRKERSGMKKKKEKEPERNVQETYSERFKEGVFLEACYDPEKNETGFVVCDKGTIFTVQEYEHKGVIYTPPSPDNSLIATECVRLPSGSQEYQSEKTLRESIRAFIHRYVEIPAEFEEIAAFYVLFSWVFDEFRELPYLRVVGDYGCGKSRFLFATGRLCYRPIFLTGSTSVSAIFRIINDVKGTIVFDEADFKFSDTTNEIVKILNSGFQKGTPVFRSEEQAGSRKKGKSFTPKPFDVYCPKIIATRKNFADEALESRCLTSPMPGLTRKDIPINLRDSFEIEALALRNQLLLFRLRKLSQGLTFGTLPQGIEVEPRLRQIITPLYSVIEDQEGRETILRFINQKQRVMEEDRFNSLEGELFQSFLEAKERSTEPTIKDICDIYNPKFGGKFEIKPKKAGQMFEQIFQLKKKRTAGGTVILNDPDNEEQIRKLKLKYGIDKPEMSNMNLESNNEGEATKEDIEEIFGVKGVPEDQYKPLKNEKDSDSLPF